MSWIKTNSGHRFAPILRTLAGIVLLVAAIAKLVGGATTVIGTFGFLLSPTFQMFLIEVELLLGVWLVSNWRSGIAHRVAIVMYLALSVVSGIMLVMGQSDCGCLGRIPMHTGVVFLFDVFCLGGLLWTWPKINADQRDPSSGMIASVSKWIGVAAIVLSVACFILSFVWSTDVSGVLARLRGNSVSSSPSSIFMGSADAHQTRRFDVTLSNHIDQDINIVGSSATCSCSVDQKFPFVLRAGESKTLSVAASFAGTPGRFSNQLVIFTDNPQQTSIALFLHGHVNAESAEVSQNMANSFVSVLLIGE